MKKALRMLLLSSSAKVFFKFILAAALFSGTAGAAVFEVGSGKTFPTVTAAFTTAGTGVTAVVGSTTFVTGHMIKIYPGTYTESITIPATLKPTSTYRLTITGVDASGTPLTSYTAATSTLTITNNGATSVFTSAVSNVTFSGLHIRGDNTSTAGTGISVNSANALNNTVEYCSIFGERYGTFASVGGAGNFNFRNCEVSTSFITDYTGIYIRGGGLVENNFIHNVGNGIFVFTAAASVITIRNNYIKDTHSASGGTSTGVKIDGASGTTLIYNNLFTKASSVQSTYPYSIMISNAQAGATYLICNNTSVGHGVSSLGDYRLTLISTSILTIKNNLLFPISGSVQGINLSLTPTTYSINNNWVSNAAKWGRIGSTDYTFASWQGLGNDASSSTIAPSLVNLPNLTTTSATAYDAKLASDYTATPGADLSAIFSTDYFQTPRFAPWKIGFHQYLGSSTVLSVTPSTGTNSSNTSITITGSSIIVVTALTIANRNITGYTVIPPSQIMASVPSGIAAGTYNVVVATEATNSTCAQKFTVTNTTPVSVTNFTPSIAGRDSTTELTIYGSGFFGGSTSTSDITAIKLTDNATGTTIVTNITIGSVVSDTQINTCLIPSGVVPGSYNIRVYTTGGSNSSITGSKRLTIVINPTVTALSATVGDNAAAKTVNISGTGFFVAGGGSSSDVESIKLASTNGLFIKNITPIPADITDLTIRGAVFPSGLHAGTYNVRVATSTGGSNSTSTQTFIVTTGIVPQVTGVVPGIGNRLAANTIRIMGSGFFGGTNENDVRLIRLSDGASTQITIGTATSDSTIINCVVPAGVSVGTYDILLTTGSATQATSSIKYTITSSTEVTNLFPGTGPNSLDATGVTIKGRFFTGEGANVALSGPQEIPYIFHNFIDSETINGVVIPAWILPGTYDVRVTSSMGTNLTSAAKWIATAAPPTVSSISPGQGSNVSLTTVTITGTGFYGGTVNMPNVTKIRMYSGSVETNLINTTVFSDTLLRSVVLPNLFAGTYDIKVSNGGGESTASLKFTVNAPGPLVSSVFPNSISRAGDATIEIEGSYFYAGTDSPAVTSVKIGTTSVSYMVSSDMLIEKVIIPTGLLHTGRYPIYVTTATGVNTLSPNLDITFDHTSLYVFPAAGLKITIPANTFANDEALIVNAISTETANILTADNKRTANIKIRSDLKNTLREIITGAGGNIAAGGLITVTFSYAGANLNDSLTESALRIATLGSDGLWSIVPGDQFVDLTAKEITCTLTHLSIFKIIQYVRAGSSLADAVVYPNPVDFSVSAGGLIKFAKLTSNPTLKIYTVSGEPVKQITPGSPGNSGNDGRIEWDGKSESGEIIARGLYIYIVTDEAGGRKIGKFAVK